MPFAGRCQRYAASTTGCPTYARKRSIGTYHRILSHGYHLAPAVCCATVANEKRWILSPARAAACLVLALGFAFSLTLGFAFRLQTGQGTFTAFVLANTATVSSAQHTWLTRGADAGAGERRREGTARG